MVRFVWMLADVCNTLFTGPFCGTYAPSVETVSSRYLYILFASDYSVQRKGFSLTFTASKWKGKRSLTSRVKLSASEGVSAAASSNTSEGSSSTLLYYIIYT